ncbi:hypothetical protein [Brevundimonas sp. PAMC22021]|uniref:hypothetical protein n=1 Tax=Brevundimonas sp. PAMC22021 TaxID=2861285 RepID=UPI001C62A93F|nr:hypothetical protein [Brevundimonas sp. PAMC22021]QYF87132.1 hypothetical protein KY493_01010 [Brevundimonas sp. PAMC22021]
MSATALRLNADIERTDVSRPFELKSAVDRQANLFKFRHEDALARSGRAVAEIVNTETSSDPGIDLPEPLQIKDAQEQFISSQEWDGYVIAVYEDKLRGIMYPVGRSDPQNEEVVEIPMEFVDGDSARYVDVGSVFRFSTGKLVRRKQVMQGSKVYFRRAARLRTNPGRASALADLFAD